MPTINVNDPFSLLLLRIIDRLAALNTDPLNPVLRLITKDLGQLEMPENPAIDPQGTALIKFENWRFKDTTDNIQTGEGDVVIKVSYAAHQHVSHITPAQSREDALKYLDKGQAVHLQLQGWAIDVPFGHMARIAMDEDTRRPGLMTQVLRYSTSMTDFSTQPIQSTAPASFAYTVELND